MKPDLLNLGCGNRFHKDWTNVDFYSTGPEVIAHNLHEGIPFGDESFDAIYHSHLLEHIPKNDAPDFMRECFRCLRPNGIIRIAIPDLETIIRCYLENLEKSIKGDAEAQKKYDWILLELFDQMVRNVSGGEMLKYWKQDPMPAESFVIERQGGEVLNFISSYRKASHRVDKDNGNTNLSPEQIGKIRLSGEIHQWMYDRYSLDRLLGECGFAEIKVCIANDSSIPNFNRYLLDIDANGSVRKPDSLFMEAVKKIDHPGLKLQSRESKKDNKFSNKLDQILYQDIELSDLFDPCQTANSKPLNIVHLCMQDFGGAGKAAYRLHKGLQSIGINSTMLVLNKKSGDPSVKVLPADFSGKNVKCPNPLTHSSPIWQKQVEKWHRLLSAYPKRAPALEMFTSADSGVRLDLIQEIQQADIINLHWVAGTMDYANAVLALKNKRIVWTLHDMNPFTGGCHYTGDCEKYKASCNACPQLGSDSAEDLSFKIWTKKHYTYQNLEMDVVTPSRWLGKCAGQSTLFSRYPVHIIPYGFPLDTFKPYPRAQIRKTNNIPEAAKVLLFGADSVANHRKGFAYLLEALNMFSLKSGYEYILATFGCLPQGIEIPSKYQLLNIGRINDENQLAQIYSAADLFVIPSLEDNLPNTVIEAMACGLPVVGFDIGGVSDMVEHHKTGYLAKPREIEDLAQGINWVISSYEKGVNFSKRCRRRVEKNYALDIQAAAYQRLYDEIMHKKF